MRAAKRWAPLLLTAAMGAASLAGCNGGSSLGPFQPEVANVTDNFQFQVTGLTGVSTTRTYSWQNTGTRASVNQSTQLTAGSATVLVRDAAGTQVYQADLTANGTFDTAAGTAGTWRITVTLSNARGAVNFRVQKHP